MNGDKMDELLTVQKETLRWIKFSAVPQLKRTLETVLTSDLDKQIFELSDGQNSSRSIAGALGVTKTPVIAKWTKWAQLGIVERLPSGQCRRLCSLGDVGIEVSIVRKEAAVATEPPEEAS